MCRCQHITVNVCIVKFSYICFNNDIAVQIQDLFVIRHNILDDKAEEGLFADMCVGNQFVPVQERKHIYKADLRIVVGEQAAQSLFVGIGNIRLQNHQIIEALCRCMIEQRFDRDAQRPHEIVVGGEYNRHVVCDGWKRNRGDSFR